MKRSSIQRTTIAVTSVIMALTSSLHSQEFELTDSDRIAIMEKLEKIEEASNERVSGLYKRAIEAYRAAIKSDTETFQLYLDCYEKVHFTDKNMKSSDFRDWKKKNDDKHGESSFRMALRYQLAWLLLSIETASKESDLTDMGPRAISHLNEIFENAEKLKGNSNMLKRNALSSIFAQAYELNIKIEDWPRSGLDIQNIYEKLVFPPLRNVAKIDSLRNAWNKKITHLGTAVEVWTENKGQKTVGMKDALRTPQMMTFLEETRPQLLWDKEKDCYEAGDERTAALNMLQHLETYYTHKDAPGWIEEFQEYVAPVQVEVSDIEE